MTESLNRLIAALRDELQNYGEMLTLLDQQQDWVFARAADKLFQSVATIQDHSLVLQQARAHRDECRGDVARHLALPDDSSLAALITRLPADYQPLVQALVQENNELLVRVQQRARQNHLLLSRSVELMQRLLATLLPGREVQVYNDSGFNRPRRLSASAVYDAIG